MHQPMVSLKDYGEGICVARLQVLHHPSIVKDQQIVVGQAVLAIVRMYA
jgi:hypothetical protein